MKKTGVVRTEQASDKDTLGNLAKRVKKQIKKGK